MKYFSLMKSIQFNLSLEVHVRDLRQNWGCLQVNQLCQKSDYYSFIQFWPD